MLHRFESIWHHVLQKNVQTLQTAVDSLQKEKEDLVFALQSAKKDTNQAKYENLFCWAEAGGLFSFVCACSFIIWQKI